MADIKFTELTENTSRHFNDIIAMVDDPAGTPVSQKMKFLNATGFIVNAQTGTSYTYLTGDYGKLVTHTNGSAIAGTLPQAGASFPANWFMFVQNRGAGALTITPTTSTIDGAATLVLNQNEGALVVSDGTNYFTLRGKATGAAGIGDVVGPASSTDNALVRFDTTTGKLIQDSPVTLDDTGVFNFPDNVRQTFNPGANAAGLNVGSIAGDPDTLANGDLWYDSTANELTGRINGANVALGAGGGGSPGGSDGDIQYRVDASTFGGGPLKRIDANTIEQKNGATTQVFRLYNTDDGAGNYERLALQVASSEYLLASEKGGTGSFQNIGIKINTSKYLFSTSSFTPPVTNSQQLGTSSLRWSSVNATDAILGAAGRIEWDGVTHVRADAGDGYLRVSPDSGSNSGIIFGNDDVNHVRLKRNGTTLETRLGGDTDFATHVAGGFRCAERSADPSAADLTSGANAKDRVQGYMKNDKLVFAYNDAGTVTFVSIPLDGSTATWTHSTSAP